MNFEIKTQGYVHKFKASQNELIIECYNYDNYLEGAIKLVISEHERKILIDVINKLK